MAVKRWTGKASNIKEIKTLTFASSTAGGFYAVTIGGKSVSITASSTNTATTALEMTAALRNEKHVYFSTIEWIQVGSDIIGTAKTAGIPFELFVSGIGFSYADTQLATGQHFFNNSSNWTPSIPAAGDDLIIADNDIGILWGMNPSAVFNSVIIEASYTGDVGHDYLSFGISADGRQRSTSAPEYRQIYPTLKVGSGDRIEINKPTGNPAHRGSRRILVNVDTQTPDIFIYDANQTRDAGRPTIRLLGTGGFNLFIKDAIGGVGIGDEIPGESAAINKLIFNPTNSNSWLITGEYCTIFEYEGRNGGKATIKRTQNLATAKNYGSETRFMGDYPVADFSSFSGRAYFENRDATAEIGNCRYYGGIVDLTTRVEACKVNRLYIENPLTAGQIIARDGMLSIINQVYWNGKTNLLNRS